MEQVLIVIYKRFQFIYMFVINSCNVHYKTKNQKRILLVDDNLDDSNEKIRKKRPRNN